jgi:hypothetical protein
MNMFQKMWAWLRDCGTDFRLERYLSNSTDIADLEHRQHKWTYMSEAEKSRW